MSLVLPRQVGNGLVIFDIDLLKKMRQDENFVDAHLAGERMSLATLLRLHIEEIIDRSIAPIQAFLADNDAIPPLRCDLLRLVPLVEGTAKHGRNIIVRYELSITLIRGAHA